jgi:hypothetical protein
MQPYPTLPIFREYGEGVIFIQRVGEEIHCPKSPKVNP